MDATGYSKDDFGVKDFGGESVWVMMETLNYLILVADVLCMKFVFKIAKTKRVLSLNTIL